MTTIGSSAAIVGLPLGPRAARGRVSEEQQTPVYEDGCADRRLRPERPRRRLRHGVFLRMCADRGAPSAGSTRRPGCWSSRGSGCRKRMLQLGDLQRLPYPDDGFDVVTGFTSFFFADDIVAALREAGRVARSGAPVVIQVFGRPERCDLEAVKAAVGPFRPRRPAATSPRSRTGARASSRSSSRGGPARRRRVRHRRTRTRTPASRAARRDARRRRRRRDRRAGAPGRPARGVPRARGLPPARRVATCSATSGTWSSRAPHACVRGGRAEARPPLHPGERSAGTAAGSPCGCATRIERISKPTTTAPKANTPAATQNATV